MPMYFQKTALRAGSTHLPGLRFQFLGVMVVVPVAVKHEWSKHPIEVSIANHVFTPDVFTFGPARFTESQVEVDLSREEPPS